MTGIRASLAAALCVWCAACGQGGQAPSADSPVAVAQPNLVCGPTTDPGGPDRVDGADPAEAPEAAGLDDGGLNAEPMPKGPVYGDPDAADRYWQAQSQMDCGLMASRIVVGEVTGNPPSEEDVIGVAKSIPSGCYPGYDVYDDAVNPATGDRGAGSCGADMPLVLEHYGVKAIHTDDTKMFDGGAETGLVALQKYLGNGHPVMACVNSTILRGDEADGGDTSYCDHMLTVAAIDTTDDRVFVGDTAGEATRNETPSVATFEKAWATGNHEMVVAFR